MGEDEGGGAVRCTPDLGQRPIGDHDLDGHWGSGRELVGAAVDPAQAQGQRRQGGREGAADMAGAEQQHERKGSLCGGFGGRELDLLGGAGAAQVQPDVTTAALADGRPQRELDAALATAAGQQRPCVGDAFPFQPTAADGAEAALGGHQHGRTSLARRRALGLGDGDEDRRHARGDQLAQ